MAVDEHEPAMDVGVSAQPARADGARPVDLDGVPDTALRSAMEFAVGIAAAGQKLRPPLAIPAGLKPHLRTVRLDRTGLASVRRAVAADDTFRNRLGEVATAELVDEIGVAWLQRSDGWQDRVRELHRMAKEAADNVSTEAALRKAERRREAAEQAAARASAELVAHSDHLAREQLRRERAEAAAAEATGQLESLRTELVGARREVDRLRQRVDHETLRADRAEAAVADARAELRVVEALRDEILATRADQPAAPTLDAVAERAPDLAAGNRIAARAMEQAAAATRDLAAALATASEALAVPTVAPAIVAVQTQRAIRQRPSARKPIAIPGGVYGDSVAAAHHLLRTPQVVAFVDGYNVAKLAWPSCELIDQRARCIDLLEDLARRTGTEIRLVFDGADVVGATGARRLIRVQYSPPDVSADDVIRAEVRALPTSRPVLVVTNDQAIVSDVRADGANVITSDMLLTVARR